VCKTEKDTLYIEINLVIYAEKSLNSRKMILLHTELHYLKDFMQKPPRYAILSHTWVENEEVLFQDIQSSTASQRKGYHKLLGCCNIARKHGYDWVWIDTCSIDKSSSAELSEAINSMFAWYESAKVCYVYLEDVHNSEIFEKYEIKDIEEHQSNSKVQNLPRWFTRGWTLQELIAPRQVHFYNSKWKMIGTKRSYSRELSRATGIDQRVLEGFDLNGIPIGARMSWASNRTTTREEDMAYSLPGLMKVHMPLLYGEGKRAFRRLQEEIIKIHDDYTIFSWTLPKMDLDRFGYQNTGIFASSPKDFQVPLHQMGTHSISFGSALREPLLVQDGKIVTSDNLDSPVVTAMGLRTRLPVIQRLEDKLIGLYFVDSPFRQLVCHCVEKQSDSYSKYARLLFDSFVFIPINPPELLEVNVQTIYLQIDRIDWLTFDGFTPPQYSAVTLSIVDDISGFKLHNIYIFPVHSWGSQAIAQIEFMVRSFRVILVIGLGVIQLRDFESITADWCHLMLPNEFPDDLQNWASLQFPNLNSPLRTISNYHYLKLSSTLSVYATVRSPPPSGNTLSYRAKELEVRVSASETLEDDIPISINLPKSMIYNWKTNSWIEYRRS
jgi:hypothetical protein